MDLLLLNLIKMENNEFHFLSDFTISAQEDLLGLLQKNGIPVYSYNIGSLRSLQLSLPPEKCPIHGPAPIGQELLRPFVMIPESRIFIRKHIMPSPMFHRTVLVWSESQVGNSTIETAMDIFEDSVMNCTEKIELGTMHSRSRLFFYTKSPEDIEVVFSRPKFQQHSKVVAISPIQETMGSQEPKYKLSSFNFFYEMDPAMMPKIHTNFIWSSNHQVTSDSEVFSQLDNFHGHFLNFAGSPFSHHMMATKRSEDDGYIPTQKYKDYWGLEPEIIKGASQTLNFTYAITNPADGLWGKIEHDGFWSGAIGWVIQGRSDVIFSAIYQTYPRRMVIDGTIHFEDDYLVTVAPAPTRIPQYLGIMAPFDLEVWGCIALSYLVISAGFYYVALSEGWVKSTYFKEWSTWNNATWYAFGTLIGESITRDLKSSNANAIRCVIFGWIYYSFIILSSYGGELKAYLTNPQYTLPIDTMQQVLDSGLPWGFVKYSEEEELILEETEDPILSAIWDGIEPIEYSWEGVLEKMERVYEGKYIIIDYENSLRPTTKVSFSRPDGMPLVHLGDRFLINNYCGWGFYPHNPWRERFDQYIQRTKETGLVNHWLERTWLRMKDWQFQVDRAAGKPPKTYEDLKSATALTISDCQGIFYLAVIMILCGCVSFALEIRAERVKLMKEEIRREIIVEQYSETERVLPDIFA